MVTKEQIDNDPTIIRNSLIIRKNNQVASQSQTTAPANAQISVFLGNVPLVARSIAIIGDSTFIGKYSYKVDCNGVNIDNNDFQLIAGGSSGDDLVAVGTGYYIPAGSYLNISVYNSGGATSDGTYSILAVFQRLDNVK